MSPQQVGGTQDAKGILAESNDNTLSPSSFSAKKYALYFDE
jgi:hypothetical protein